MDLGWCRSFLEEVFGPVVDRWFRPRLVGYDRIPAEGPAVLAANHSGTCFPYDAMVLDALLWRRGGMSPGSKVRTAFEPELASRWWMRPFGLEDFWRRGGGVDATFDNCDRLLERGERLVIYPEGVAGIGKGFHRRYRLRPFHTGSITLAARHGCPFVPIHVVNGEWILPFNVTFPPLDRLMEALFHVPFLPLPGGFLAVSWPWVWWLALPARLVYVVGEPIDVAALAREEGISDPWRAGREAFVPVAERVREIMQRDLDRHVAEHGRRPYHARSLARRLAGAGRALPGILPTGWAVRAIRHDRNRGRPRARGRLHAIARDLDLAAFFVPFGWPLLTLARRFRKPPCGYRGLSREERRLREGLDRWRLADHPLPPAVRERGRPRSAAGAS